MSGAGGCGWPSWLVGLRVTGWSRCLVVVASGMLLAPVAGSAAEIPVQGACTLVDAIDAANDDDDAGGKCPPGGSGADVLRLAGDVELTALHNTTRGANGTPVITSDVTIAGEGFAIERAEGAEDFRLLHVAYYPNRLRLENVALRNGAATLSGFYDAVGGAVLTRYADLELFATTVEGNRADNGGAIFGYTTDIVLESTTLSGNSAQQLGGAVGSYLSDVVVTNSTISGNVAYGGDFSYGGGIWAGYGTNLALVHSTVAANTAVVGGGISDLGSFQANLSIYGSIIGYNAGGNCAVYFIDDDDAADNLADDDTCGTTFGDLEGLDPVLADNGGPTATHTLLAGSSAIDGAGDCGLAADQRGFARDAACDVGALEHGAAGVGGSASGLRVRRVTCRNVDTGQEVGIGRPGGAWSCEAAGLAVTPGDRIRQRVEGLPAERDLGATGIDVGALRVRCRNLSSGDEVSFDLLGTRSWSCTDEGLAFDRGDRIVQQFEGVAD